MAATDLGLTQRAQGHLRDALDTYRTGLAFIEAHGARRMGFTSRLLTALGAALYDQNELEAARQVLEEAVELNRRWRNPNHTMFSHNHLARVLTALGDDEGATRQLNEARAGLQGLPVIATLIQGLESAEITLLLARGRAAEIRWLEAQIGAACARPDPGLPYMEARAMQHNLLARVLLAQNRLPEADLLLARLESEARRCEIGSALVEIRALQALSSYAQHKLDPALAALHEAIALSEPQGSLRSIGDTAALVPGGLAALSGALRQRLAGETPPNGALLVYLERLAALLPAPLASNAGPALRAPTAGAHLAPSALVEPLSAREMEVLHLLAEGLTNLQIAARLVISAGTVKAHTANIFRKLDVANRTQAVTRAREMGVL
jgi:LuxR family transcriptional regulator, maltose regulon positive regulatory protein